MKVSIAGASGYVGGELLRLFLSHPKVDVLQVTSESRAGKPVTQAHPNLRQRTRLTFSRLANLSPCDALFLALPHNTTAALMPELRQLAPIIIDLSADFRLKSQAEYKSWYRYQHPEPELLSQFVYGLPELHRQQLKETSYIAGVGCLATACILALAPLFKNQVVEPQAIIEGKLGSSAGGNRPSLASHHPERSQAVRTYAPAGHRHTAEIIQELSFHQSPAIHLTASSIGLVRGILATGHVFLNQELSNKDLWQIYRSFYQDEPFIRLVKERQGIYRCPEPKLVAGTNYCDLGFERDPRSKRVVVMAAIDNLMKGAAGTAVQAFNIRMGWPETTALEFCGLHP